MMWYFKINHNAVASKEAKIKKSQISTKDYYFTLHSLTNLLRLLTTCMGYYDNNNKCTIQWNNGSQKQERKNLGLIINFYI